MPEIPLALLRAVTVVPFRAAIVDRLSPFLTVYRVTVAGFGFGLLLATTVLGLDLVVEEVVVDFGLVVVRLAV